MYRETAQEKGWVNLYEAPSYHPTRPEFLIRAPIDVGAQGEYRHILRVLYGQSNIQEPVTRGTFEVTGLYGWDSSGMYM